MCMDKLVAELLTLLNDMLAGQERLLKLALARREAMRTFDVNRLEGLAGQERAETLAMAVVDRRRQVLVAQFRNLLGGGGRNVEPTVSEIARRVADRVKSQLLGLAGRLKERAELVGRNTRRNATRSDTVGEGLADGWQVVT